MKINEEVQYIWHDGVRIREDQLVNMAMSAGTYALAEHYVCSLLAHGCANGLAYIINKANEIREHYQVPCIPMPKMKVEEAQPKKNNQNDRMMKYFQKLSKAERKHVLKNCLEYIHANNPDMFKRKNHWQGAYMVFRDRLDNGLKMSEFYDWAYDATPSCWPESLKISDTVFKNYSRDIRAEDDEAYYEMAYNPHKDFCEDFWEVVSALIMKEI